MPPWPLLNGSELSIIQSKKSISTSRSETTDAHTALSAQNFCSHMQITYSILFPAQFCPFRQTSSQRICTFWCLIIGPQILGLVIWYAGSSRPLYDTIFEEKQWATNIYTFGKDWTEAGTMIGAEALEPKKWASVVGDIFALWYSQLKRIQ